MTSAARPEGRVVAPTHAGAPLTDEHLRQIGAARRAARSVTRCAAVAAMSGWTTAAFAALSALFVVMTSDYGARSLFITAALGVVALVELRGGAAVRRFDAVGARRLWVNQAAFGVTLVVYAAWGLAESTGGSPLAGQSTGDARLDASIERLGRLVTFALYGGIALAGLLGPGMMALYYARRMATLRRFLATTPEWIVQTLRAGI